MTACGGRVASDRRLRVAMVTRAIASLHGSGGLERHVDDLVRHLLERGVEVALITRPPRPVIPTDAPELRHERLTLSTVPYHTFPFAGRRGTTVLDRNTAYLWFGLRAGRRAARLVADRQVDLVHGHGASVLGAVFPTTTLPVPLVFTPHGLEEFGGTDPSRAGLKRIAYRPLQVAVRRCARSAARVVASLSGVARLIAFFALRICCSSLLVGCKKPRLARQGGSNFRSCSAVCPHF